MSRIQFNPTLLDRKAYNFYLNFRYENKSEKSLPIKQIQEYTYNASVLNSLLEIIDNLAAYAKATGVKPGNLWNMLSDDVNNLKHVPHTLPGTSRGLRLKAKKYKDEGYISLISFSMGNTITINLTDLLESLQTPPKPLLALHEDSLPSLREIMAAAHIESSPKRTKPFFLRVQNALKAFWKSGIAFLKRFRDRLSFLKAV